MKKRFLVAMILIVTVFSMTGCGRIFKAMDNYRKAENAKEILQNEIQNTPGVEFYGGSTELDLNDAINDALEENGETMIDGEGELKFDVPEGFVYNESVFCYQTRDSMASFNYLTTPQDGSFARLNKLGVELQFEQQFSMMYQEDVDVEMLSWENITIDGYDAIRYAMSLEVLGNELVETQIVINGDTKLHFFTHSYNCMTDIYIDELAELEKSLRFEKD